MVAAIALLLGIAWAADTSGEVLFDTLLVGIPVALAATVTIVVARRTA